MKKNWKLILLGLMVLLIFNGICYLVNQRLGLLHTNGLMIILLGLFIQSKWK